MRMNKALVFFDYDGTIVDESEKIYRPTKTTLETINKIKSGGGLVVLATGRAKSYVPDLGIEWDGIVSSNGAYAEINGKTIYNKLVDDELLREFVEKAETIGYKYALENQDVCYTNGFDDDHFMDTLKFFDINRTNFRPVSEADVLRANKMFMTFSEMSVFNEAVKEFEGRYIMGLHRNNLSCDVDTVGNNKSIGVCKLIEYLGIDKADTYAFGDGINDYEMIECVGHGIAMGVHHQKLDDVCEFVTDTVKNEGITAGLIRLGVIN